MVALKLNDRPSVSKEELTRYIRESNNFTLIALLNNYKGRDKK
jgi:hypothetical protein